MRNYFLLRGGSKKPKSMSITISNSMTPAVSCMSAEVSIITVYLLEKGFTV